MLQKKKKKIRSETENINWELTPFGIFPSPLDRGQDPELLPRKKEGEVVNGRSPDDEKDSDGTVDHWRSSKYHSRCSVRTTGGNRRDEEKRY